MVETCCPKMKRLLIFFLLSSLLFVSACFAQTTTCTSLVGTWITAIAYEGITVDEVVSYQGQPLSGTGAISFYVPPPNGPCSAAMTCTWTATLTSPNNYSVTLSKIVCNANGTLCPVLCSQLGTTFSDYAAFGSDCQNYSDSLGGNFTLSASSPTSGPQPPSPPPPPPPPPPSHSAADSVTASLLLFCFFCVVSLRW